MEVLLVEGAILVLMSLFLTELTVADVLRLFGLILHVGMNRTIANIAFCPIDTFMIGVCYCKSYLDSLVFLLFR